MKLGGRFFLMCIFFFTSCSQKPDAADLAHLNGYWEIAEVEFANGGKKTYKVNETIDLFNLTNGVGTRKKVKQQLDGTYPETDHTEAIRLIEKDGASFIEYSTDFGKWREEILRVSEEELILKNDQQTEYHYKRPVPFTLE